MMNWLSKALPTPKASRSAIGLMSGTSLDGLDACIVRENKKNHRIEVVNTQRSELPIQARDGLQKIIESGEVNLDTLLHIEHQYTEAVIEQCKMLIESSDEKISVIGFHGQTLWHAPHLGSTLQIGFAERLAEATLTPVAHQFRRGDMARGGQGAPLAPLFHASQFSRDTENVAVLNLGGIANLSLLVSGKPIKGWDLGPANTLSDIWHQIHQAKSFDYGGKYAASGCVNDDLLTALLDDPYFEQSPPKSTGREYFSSAWLFAIVNQFPFIEPTDVQATLNRLTAVLVDRALSSDIDILVVCGGGIHNVHLMEQIDNTVQPLVVTSEVFSVDPDFVEAACFGWLGLKCLDQQIMETSSITGSRVAGVLGSLVFPTL
jgi:anhydro-N-acetylmuramic acid kinase